METFIGLSYIERPVLGDNPKAHKVDNEKRALFVKSTCAFREKQQKQLIQNNLSF